MPESAANGKRDREDLFGSPATVAEKILAVRDQVGPFGSIVTTGLDWDDKGMWKNSMALMANEVMPLLNQATTETIAAQ